MIVRRRLLFISNSRVPMPSSDSPEIRTRGFRAGDLYAQLYAVTRTDRAHDTKTTITPRNKATVPSVPYSTRESHPEKETSVRVGGWVVVGVGVRAHDFHRARIWPSSSPPATTTTASFPKSSAVSDALHHVPLLEASVRAHAQPCHDPLELLDRHASQRRRSARPR